MTYQILKALHIIGFVSWFAGLLYIVRLFIYHTEANDKPESEKNILQNQFTLMERRLWFGITTPAMIITLICGIGLITYWDLATASWLHLKLALLFFLLLYHHFCGAIRKALTNNRFPFSSKSLRIINEIGTLFLVSIVLAATLKDPFNALTGTGIAFVIGCGLFGISSLVQKKRNNHSPK